MTRARPHPSASPYGSRWSTCTAVLSAAGVGVSFLLWHPLITLGVLIVTTICSAALICLAAPDQARRAGPLWATVAAVHLAAGGIAAGVVLSFSPVGGLALCLGVLAASPVGRRLVRRATRGAEPSPPPALEQPAEEVIGPHVTPLHDAVSVRALSVEALCQAWRRSYVILQCTATVPGTLAVVVMRQLYLDELARRDPSALTAWLSSGARAASSPARFLSEPRRPEADPSTP